MNFTPVNLEGLEGRAESLKSIKRYGMYDIMYFRTDVEMHSRRMEWIADVLSPYFSQHEGFDPLRLRLLCRVHDDSEIITGDHQLGRKIHTMSKGELDAMERGEQRAIEILSSRWPVLIQGYSYGKLLREAHEKETFGAQLMKLIDRLDAYGESSHEIFSGNACFLSHPELPEGVNPVQTYTEILSQTPKRFPLLTRYFEGRHPFLSSPNPVDSGQIARTARLPNKKSVKGRTGNLHYDLWREITLNYGGEEGLRWLTEQKEFNMGEYYIENATRKIGDKRGRVPSRNIH